MSAGGVNYSCIVGRGKVTLPSVESWGTNMNILRDPPKSITTRRVDKVGQTSSITEMIDESGDRACEGISVYARGVNPFVSVSYGNEGTNGGQVVGDIRNGSRGQAKLPYTVIKDGAFRPPILLQEDLLPLSRMPRVWTSAFSKPGFTDFSKKMRTCGTAADTKEVKTQKLQGFVRPTATYRIEQPITEPFEFKYMIQPTIKNSVSSGIRTMNITQTDVQVPTKEIYTNTMHAMARTNMTDSRKFVNENYFDTGKYTQNTNAHAVATNPGDIRHHVTPIDELDTRRYIQDTNVHAVVTNPNSNLYTTDLNALLSLGQLPAVRDEAFTYSYDAPISGYDQVNYIHDDIQLTKNLPDYHARTNVSDPTHFTQQDYQNSIMLDRNIPVGSYHTNMSGNGYNDHGSRDARLPQKINPGGFMAPTQIPTHDRMQMVNEHFESDKAKMNKKISDQMFGRFDNNNPYLNPANNSMNNQASIPANIVSPQFFR